MEKLGQVLKSEAQTTNTRILHRPSYNDCGKLQDKKSDVSIPQIIAYGAAVDLNLPVAVCEDCGEPQQKDMMILGIMRRLPIICRCRAEEIACEEEREKRLILQRRLDKFKAYSLMDKRFSESTFENWVFRDDNRELYDFGKQYCENWDTVCANNRGLLIHGVASNGKTFLSFAIANELYKLGEAVLAISVSRILKVIQDSYGKHGDLGEIDVLNTLSEASLLILDDLGVEHKTNWSYEKLYSIIDTRSRAKKPTIITTNLSIGELRENLSIVDIKSGHYDETHRIYSRIVEMCAFIEVEGESWRIQKGEENRLSLFRELGMNTGKKS